MAEAWTSGPTGNLNHSSVSDSLRRLEGDIWPITFKIIIIKTPLLAAGGFLILGIQIRDRFMA
ncbi:MAG TPA: hypothetical protein PK823_02765 [Novosphingobium sp.]|nr:hypothetical protein [Novosphingobium sp.]